MRQRKSSVIGDTTATKSNSLLQTGTPPPVFRRRRTGNQSHLTTGICIRSAPHRKHVRKAKGLRRVATRYDRYAHTFMSAIHSAASVIFYLAETEWVLSLTSITVNESGFCFVCAYSFILSILAGLSLTTLGEASFLG